MGLLIKLPITDDVNEIINEINEVNETTDGINKIINGSEELLGASIA